MRLPILLLISQDKNSPARRNDRFSEPPAGLHTLTILSVVKESDHKDKLVVLQTTALERSRFFSTLWRQNSLSVQKVGMLLAPGLENGQQLPSIPPRLIAHWKLSISRYDAYATMNSLFLMAALYSLYELESQLVMGNVLLKLNVPTKSMTRFR